MNIAHIDIIVAKMSLLYFTQRIPELYLHIYLVVTIELSTFTQM